MKRSQLLILILAVIAVGGVALLSAGGGGDDSGDGAETGPAAPEGAVRVPFAYSPEKEKLLVPLIKRFNAERVAVGGRPVFVEGSVVSSGEAEADIAAGDLQPVAWSPASSLWGRLLNFEADQELAPDENPSIVRTPLVIAMWEPFARALGWPKRQIGFEQIIQLARSNQGFAAFGHPEFGRFKLVHTNPDFSTSGLEAVVAEYYAATGKQEGLTEQDVESSKARAIVRDIERSIVHYGDTTLFIADQMRKEGPGYASAVAMEEVTLLDFNRNRGPQPKLIALYPPEGTFYSDNPFIVLNGAWVRPAQRQGAERFQEFLAEEITPELAARSGFRPADLETEAVPPVSKENGVDPAQPKRVLGLPEPRTLDRIRRAWREDRKPANVLLVVDTSGSMNDEDRLVRAKQGLDAFFEQVGKQDSVGLNIFSDRAPVAAADCALPRERAADAPDGRQPDRRRRHSGLRRDHRGLRDRARRRRPGPDQRGRRADGRRGHGLGGERPRRRRGRSLPGRLGRAGARVHYCLQRRCAGRRRGAGRDRGGLGWSAL